MAFCTLFLGNAHLQSGEIEEAARVVGAAAGLAAKTRSPRLVRELHATRPRMQPWQHTQAVSMLDGPVDGLRPDAWNGWDLGRCRLVWLVLISRLSLP